MRLKGVQPDRVGGWLRLVEEADVSAGYVNGFPVGVMVESRNFARNTASGRLEVRGGAEQALALVDGAAVAMDEVLFHDRYSQSGQAIVAVETAGEDHYVFLYNEDLSALDERLLLGWAGATPAKARFVELFEELYIIDANDIVPARRTMQFVKNTAGVWSTGNVQAKLDGVTAEDVKPYCHAVHNNVLFIAGQDAASLEAPAMVRHSFLGRNPSDGDGFDKDAYAFIGSKGERVNAMEPGHELLIAKGHELYILSGFGRAYEGWNYVVHPLDNTEGVGVEWPGAITYAEGWWYGVGAGGPFITDGKDIEVLTVPRRKSWKTVGALDRAVVRFHPERRVILFALPTNGATKPNVLWLWSVDEEAWVGEYTLPKTINHLFAASTNAEALPEGPTGAPGAITFDHAAATQTQVSASFVITDAAAHTRVWIDKGAGFVLDQTLAPADDTFVITGLTDSQAYPVKLQHLRGGQLSGFSAEASGYTRLETPAVSAVGVPASLPLVAVATATLTYAHDELRFYRDTVLVDTQLNPSAGANDYNDLSNACDGLHTYEAEVFRSTWPAAIQTSAKGADTATACEE